MPVKPTKKSIKQEIKKVRSDMGTMNMTTKEMSSAKAGYKSKIKALKKQKRSM